MSERWKPEDVYYFVDSIGMVGIHKWFNDSADNAYYESGNCFKTEAEAKAASEKVKAILLSLHKPVTACNQLPKLTAEVFNRPDCPVWAKYAAVNRNNTASWFNDKPIYDGNKSCLWLCKETPYYVAVETIPGVWDASDWQNSLVERPAQENKLPEWCKVGEWGFDPNRFVYFKIKQIDGRLVDVKEQGCNYVHQRQVSAFKRFKQARLRPYNAEEMKALLGKVICTIEDKSFVVLAYLDNMVLFGDILHTAEDLTFDRYNFQDGNPCGKLEHLKNGEWVE